MRPKAKPFRMKPKRDHTITVKQHNGAYLTQCSCGETLGGMHSSRMLGRRAGEVHLRKVAPHLAGPQA